MSAFFFTEASRQVGFGHLTRCLAIAQALQELKIKAQFFIRGDQTAINLIGNFPATIVNWTQAKSLSTILATQPIISIVDSYLAPRPIYQLIAQQSRLSLAIDDSGRLIYPTNLILNSSPQASLTAYPNKSSRDLLLGVNYHPLRREFWDVAPIKIRPTIKGVLLTFGGDDIRNLTAPILKLLQTNNPELKISVVVGRAFNQIKEIQRMANDHTTILMYPSALEMATEMSGTDVAISAGGQTLFELARFGVPTIAVIVAENQQPNVNAWAKQGFLLNAGEWQDDQLMESLERQFTMIKSLQIRQKCHTAAIIIGHGQGARQVAQVLVNRLK